MACLEFKRGYWLHPQVHGSLGAGWLACGPIQANWGRRSHLTMPTGLRLHVTWPVQRSLYLGG